MRELTQCEKQARQGYDTWRVTESYFSGGNEKANKSENISTLANIFVFE